MWVSVTPATISVRVMVVVDVVVEVKVGDCARARAGRRSVRRV